MYIRMTTLLANSAINFGAQVFRVCGLNYLDTK